eukprot:COSAG05_NODE_307_length_11680_cov_162.848804_2_plen_88_part_00
MAAGGQSHSALVAGNGLRVSIKWTDMPGACLGSVSAGNGVLNGLRVVCAGFIWCRRQRHERQVARQGRHIERRQRLPAKKWIFALKH